MAEGPALRCRRQSCRRRGPGGGAVARGCPSSCCGRRRRHCRAEQTHLTTCILLSTCSTGFWSGGLPAHDRGRQPTQTAGYRCELPKRALACGIAHELVLNTENGWLSVSARTYSCRQGGLQSGHAALTCKGAVAGADGKGGDLAGGGQVDAALGLDGRVVAGHRGVQHGTLDTAQHARFRRRHSMSVRDCQRNRHGSSLRSAPIDKSNLTRRISIRASADVPTWYSSCPVSPSYAFSVLPLVGAPAANVETPLSTAPTIQTVALPPAARKRQTCDIKVMQPASRLTASQAVRPPHWCWFSSSCAVLLYRARRRRAVQACWVMHDCMQVCWRSE